MFYRCYRLGICAVLVLLISLAFLPACEATTSGYIKYVQKEGIAHFSFEYPEEYEEASHYSRSNYTSVSYARWQNDGWLDSHFRIGAYKPGWAGYNNSNDLIEGDEKLLSDEKDYQIIERSTISIAGISGILLIRAYTIEDMFDSDLKEPTLLIDRTIYFDYDGLIWEIMMDSIENVAEADEAIWEHLVETFKILD